MDGRPGEWCLEASCTLSTICTCISNMNTYFPQKVELYPNSQTIQLWHFLAVLLARPCHMTLRPVVNNFNCQRWFDVGPTPVARQALHAYANVIINMPCNHAFSFKYRVGPTCGLRGPNVVRTGQRLMGTLYNY